MNQREKEIIKEYEKLIEIYKRELKCRDEYIEILIEQLIDINNLLDRIEKYLEQNKMVEK